MDRTKILPLALAVLGFAISPSLAGACKLRPNSPWHADHKSLVSSTSTIVLARLKEGPKSEGFIFQSKAKYTFDVIKTIKGKIAAKTVSVMGAPFDPKAKRVSYRQNCSIFVSFENTKTYLLFIDSFHPDGYKEVTGPDDPWVHEVEQMVAGGQH